MSSITHVKAPKGIGRSNKDIKVGEVYEIVSFSASGNKNCILVRTNGFLRWTYLGQPQKILNYKTWIPCDKNGVEIKNRKI